VKEMGSQRREVVLPLVNQHNNKKRVKKTILELLMKIGMFIGGLLKMDSLKMRKKINKL